MVKDKLKTKSRNTKDKLNHVERTEKAFKRITTDQIHYVSLGMKKNRLREINIPLKATSFYTEKVEAHWYNLWNLCKRRRKLYAPEVVVQLEETDSQYEIKITKKHWRYPFFQFSSAIAVAFSASNLLHFPYDCIRHGGGSFFIVYFLLVIILIQPLVYLEMLVGQFSQSGVSGFSDLHKYTIGLPQAIVYMALVFIPYNNIVLGYTGAYAFGLIQGLNPGICSKDWSSFPYCISYNEVIQNDVNYNSTCGYKNGKYQTSTISTELYFREYILHRTWEGKDIEDTNYWVSPNWNFKLYLGLGITFVIVFVATHDFLTSSLSHIIICASYVSLIVLFGLMGHQLTYEGAVDGVTEFLSPTKLWLQRLIDFGFWGDAIGHAIVSVGIGYGIYPRISSKNPSNFNNLYATSWYVCILTGLYSFLAVLLVYTEIGITGHQCNIDNIFVERTGISFIALSGAALKITESTIPFIIIFILFNFYGVWLQVVAAETCTSYFVTWLKPCNKRLKLRTLRSITLIATMLVQLLMTALVSRAGSFMLESPRVFEGSWPAAFVAITELFALVFLYKLRLFSIDAEIMLKQSLPKLFQYQIVYFTPPLLCVCFIVLTIQGFLRPINKYLGVIDFPDWLSYIAYILNLIPVFLILLRGIIYSRIKKPKNRFAISRKDLTFRKGMEGTKKAYSRLMARRKSIFQTLDQNVRRVKLRGVLDKAAIQESFKNSYALKKDLNKLIQRRRAISNWLRLTNLGLLQNRKVVKIKTLVNYYIRELDVKKNDKEVQYLQKVTNKFSLENVFLIATMPDALIDHPVKEYKYLLHGHLNSIPETELGIVYPELSPFERLVGKRNPTPKEDKLEIIYRIKKHLRVPINHVSVRMEKKANDDKINLSTYSVYNEEAPLEFYFTYHFQDIRVLLIYGEDHSFLKSLGYSKQKIIKIPISEILDKSGNVLKLYLINLITENINRTSKGSLKIQDFAKGLTVKSFREKFTKLAGIRSHTGNRESSVAPESDLSVDPSEIQLKALNSLKREKALFQPLPIWYYGIDIDRYHIIPENTYFIVIVTYADALRKEKYRWFTRPIKRKIWPDYKVYPNPKPEVHETSFAQLNYFQSLIEKRNQMLNVPEDIVYNEFEDYISKSSSHESASSDSDKIASNSFTIQRRKLSSSSSNKSIDSNRSFGSFEYLPVPEVKESNQGSNIDLYFLRRPREVPGEVYTSEHNLTNAVLAESKRAAFGRRHNFLPRFHEQQEVQRHDLLQKGRRHNVNVNLGSPRIQRNFDKKSRKREARMIYHVPSDTDHSDGAKPIWSKDSMGKRFRLDNGVTIQERGNKSGYSTPRMPTSRTVGSSRLRAMKREMVPNENEDYLYTPEGRMLVVQLREGNENVVVMANPSDSIFNF